MPPSARVAMRTHALRSFGPLPISNGRSIEYTLPWLAPLSSGIPLCTWTGPGRRQLLRRSDLEDTDVSYRFRDLAIDKIGVVGSGNIGPDIALYFAKEIGR